MVTWLIWTLSQCVICSEIYWPGFWPWHGWFGLSASAWFVLKSTDLISDSDMVDLDSQAVRDLLLNLLTGFLMVTWLIWTLSLCVVALEPIVIVSDLIMADFLSQASRLDVCGFFPLEPASWSLTLFSLISTFSRCAVCSLLFSWMAWYIIHKLTLRKRMLTLSSSTAYVVTYWFFLPIFTIWSTLWLDYSLYGSPARHELWFIVV